jgi:pyruvate-formate lyase
MSGAAVSTKPKIAKDQDCWRAFNRGSWCNTIDVRDFIVRNATPYTGDEKFLAGASKRTKAVWAKLQPYFKDEQKKGVLAVARLGTDFHLELDEINLGVVRVARRLELIVDLPRDDRLKDF